MENRSERIIFPDFLLTTRKPSLENTLCLYFQDRVTANNVLVVAETLSILTDNNVEIDDDNLQDISSILSNIVAVNDSSLNVSVKKYFTCFININPDTNYYKAAYSQYHWTN